MKWVKQKLRRWFDTLLDSLGEYPVVDPEDLPKDEASVRKAEAEMQKLFDKINRENQGK